MKTFYAKIDLSDYNDESVYQTVIATDYFKVEANNKEEAKKAIYEKEQNIVASFYYQDTYISHVIISENPFEPIHLKDI